MGVLPLGDFGFEDTLGDAVASVARSWEKYTGSTSSINLGSHLM